MPHALGENLLVTHESEQAAPKELRQQLFYLNPELIIYPHLQFACKQDMPRTSVASSQNVRSSSRNNKNSAATKFMLWQYPIWGLRTL